MKGNDDYEYYIKKDGLYPSEINNDFFGYKGSTCEYTELWRDDDGTADGEGGWNGDRCMAKCDSNIECEGYKVRDGHCGLLFNMDNDEKCIIKNGPGAHAGWDIFIKKVKPGGVKKHEYDGYNIEGECGYSDLIGTPPSSLEECMNSCDANRKCQAIATQPNGQCNLLWKVNIDKECRTPDGSAGTYGGSDVYNCYIQKDAVDPPVIPYKAVKVNRKDYDGYNCDGPCGYDDKDYVRCDRETCSREPTAGYIFSVNNNIF